MEQPVKNYAASPEGHVYIFDDDDDDGSMHSPIAIALSPKIAQQIADGLNAMEALKCKDCSSHSAPKSASRRARPNVHRLPRQKVQ